MEKDFESDIVDWEVLPSENEMEEAASSKTNELDEIDTLYSDAQDNVMYGVQVIPKAEWTKAEVKLAMMITANEGWRVKSCDIKSAYLQGQDLERDILVRPPVE